MVKTTTNSVKVKPRRAWCRRGALSRPSKTFIEHVPKKGDCGESLLTVGRRVVEIRDNCLFDVANRRKVAMATEL